MGPEAHAVLGKRGAEEMATELLQADAIVRGDQPREMAAAMAFAGEIDGESGM